jgi:hypothetical protein
MLPDTGRYCTARKTNGEPCPNFAVKGDENQKCRAHGGTAGGRPITTAKHSKFVPAQIRQRYEEFVNDPDYIGLREQIATVETRISQLWQRLAVGDSSERRKDILKDVEEAVEAAQESLLREDILADLEDMELPAEVRERRALQVIRGGRELQRRLIGLLSRAKTERREDEVWEDMDRFSESLRKLKETEVKRHVAAAQSLTVTESYALLRRLVTVIEDYLEPEALEEARRAGELHTLKARAIREVHSILNRKGGGKQ